MKTVNIQNVCDEFTENINEVERYINKCKTVFVEDKDYLYYSYENAVILLYKSLEKFILRTMISCLNHDHSHFEAKYGIKLGNHINDDVCEFLITKGGYFDFKRKSGLNKVLNAAIGANHNIGKVIKQTKYGPTIDQLCTARNYAAHNSVQSKREVMEVYKLERISSPGKFLSQKNRLQKLINGLKDLSDEVKHTPMF